MVDPMAPESWRTDIRRRVFLVHGRDQKVRRCFIDLLHALDLRPLEWEDLVLRTGNTAPSVQDVVMQGPYASQAVLVLATPDDVVQAHPDVLRSDEPQHSYLQVRPNVAFELGQALAVSRARTIVVKIGDVQFFSDVGGLDYVDFRGTSRDIRQVVQRLRQAGCAIDDAGSDWLDEERFSALPAYQRTKP